MFDTQTLCGRPRSRGVASESRRRLVLAGVLAIAILLAVVVLAEVIWTVIFAVTIAYVLYPVREWLRRRGLSRRGASAAIATGALVIVTAIIGAFAVVLFRQRDSLLNFIDRLPPTVEVPLGEFTYTIETSSMIEIAEAALADLAVAIASASLVIALKLFLFAILVFGLLLQPTAGRQAIFGLVPPDYHDVVIALHERVRQTLYGIYVLQAATATGTFLMGLVVFAALGYPSAFGLAVVAGILQFIPVVGPGVLLALLAGIDLVGGNLTRAALVVVVGGLFVGIVPDVIIRPRLAEWAAHLPTTLYFTGFVGGILTVGPVGFVVGPLVIALLVEAVELLSDDVHQSPIDDASGSVD